MDIEIGNKYILDEDANTMDMFKILGVNKYDDMGHFKEGDIITLSKDIAFEADCMFLNEDGYISELINLNIVGQYLREEYNENLEIIEDNNSESMSCKIMMQIERDFDFLSHEYISKIKRIPCSYVCGGNCQDKYCKNSK